MAKSIIHVNRHHIAANKKDDGNRPVYTIKNRGSTKYAREVVINGPSKLIYDKKGLSCGAKAYIETDAELTLIDEMTYQESKCVSTEQECLVDMLHQTCPHCMIGDLREKTLQDSWDGILTCANCERTMDRFKTN
jgi:hypothetical protein